MQFDYIVLGGTGLLGSVVCEHLESLGASFLSVHSKNYLQSIGSTAKALINCNGNAYRFKANQNPAWDFEASVASVLKSLFDFKADFYVYMSTIDIYDDRQNPQHNHEEVSINNLKLDTYGFHKWLSERLVEKHASKPLILRLGGLIGRGLKKGPLYDLLHEKPLFISPESEISFIDTPTVAKIIVCLIEKNISHEIFNVTSQGGARLGDLQDFIPFPLKVFPKAESMIHKYNIANAKTHSLFPMHTSLETAKKYIQAYLEEAHAKRS